MRPGSIAVAVLLALASTGCSSGSPSSRSTTSPSSGSPSTTASVEASEVPTTVRLEVGGRQIEAELDAGATARDLAGQLPLKLTFRDFGGQEKIATLPRPLTVAGAPSGADPEANEIGYYAPDNVLVLYYEDIGYFAGIVRLGRMSPEDMAFLKTQRDGFTVTVTAI